MDFFNMRFGNIFPSGKIPIPQKHKFHRSNRPEVFCRRGVPGNFAKFTGKHLSQSFFFNKVVGGILFVRFRLFFIKVFIFVQQKA